VIRQLLTGSAGAGLIGLGLVVALEGTAVQVAFSGWALVLFGAVAMSWAVGAS
jgi:hypothetical protein